MRDKSDVIILPKGTYYIGDPCYVVDESKWGDLLDATNFFGIEADKKTGLRKNDFIYNGKLCWAHSTYYGDGSYKDNENKKYSVDAGLISIMPIESTDVNGDGLGNIYTFDKDFSVWYDEGDFHFDSITIRTK